MPCSLLLQASSFRAFDARRDYSCHAAGVALHARCSTDTQYVLANRSQGPNALNDTTSELYGMTSYLLESIQSHANRSEPLAACRLSASKIPETLGASSPISTSHTARLTHASERPISPPLVLSSSRFGIWSTAPAKPAGLRALQPPHGDI
ncbi:uncharacterized protein PAN0_013c4620 [Moesziomyces antarcticus]|uniref:Uncharacterized protein n=2 Tax=Pseudozyma antarctica TaxID=84753 RepID=A0A081CIA2_PSEA2|nr:uncharacterized protein PAN0_013c4620 [Moesziomyces antarcticus]GAK66398.1 hypothetical protein PAN0_013c4620 [Moesziomyces antarcticus]SPO47437.1 uncharacterized protein PSANT_05125 [Moesziomyces antarcticus]